MDSYRHDGLTFDVSDAAPGNAVPREADPGHSHLGSAEAVVLLHGFPQDRHCWQAVARQLNEAGLRTLAPDQRGYSPGACPPAVSDYAMEHLVGDVVALLDAAHVQRAHLVGHDWGGGVAWALAATHPERVASLTVLSTPHPAAMGAAMLHGQVLRSWYMGAFQVPRLPERLLARQLPRALRGAGLPPAEVRRYADRFAEPERLRGPINWYPGHGAWGSPARLGRRHRADDLRVGRAGPLSGPGGGAQDERVRRRGLPIRTRAGRALAARDRAPARCRRGAGAGAGRLRWAGRC